MLPTNTKVPQLESLRQEILATIVNPWLFPTRGEVKGFMGAAKVMFVGERPSTGRFGGSSDHLLYTILEKYGAADAHLTDIIKTRGKVGDPYPDNMTPHRHIFDREMEIVQPRLVLAFGQKVYDLLQFTLAGSGIKVGQVWHYSYTRRGADKALQFDQQIRRVLGK